MNLWLQLFWLVQNACIRSPLESTCVQHDSRGSAICTHTHTHYVLPRWPIIQATGRAKTKYPVHGTQNCIGSTPRSPPALNLGINRNGIHLCCSAYDRSQPPGTRMLNLIIPLQAFKRLGRAPSQISRIKNNLVFYNDSRMILMGSHVAKRPDLTYFCVLTEKLYWGQVCPRIKIGTPKTCFIPTILETEEERLNLSSYHVICKLMSSPYWNCVQDGWHFPPQPPKNLSPGFNHNEQVTLDNHNSDSLHGNTSETIRTVNLDHFLIALDDLLILLWKPQESSRLLLENMMRITVCEKAQKHKTKVKLRGSSRPHPQFF